MIMSQIYQVIHQIFWVMFEFIINILDHIPSTKYIGLYIFNIRMCFGCAICKTEIDCSNALFKSKNVLTKCDL